MGAMNAAGYKGSGRIYEAARDIEERADLLRQVLGGSGNVQFPRILAEYEKIAFSDDESVRVADRLRALEIYRALTSCESGTDGCAIVVNYDYGGEG